MQTPIVFIEKEFLRGFSKLFVRKIDRSTNWVLLDFFTFLTKGIIEFKLVLDIESEDQLDSFFKEFPPIFKSLENKIRKPIYIPDFKKALKSNFSENENAKSPFSLFFVGWDRNTCDKYELTTGFLFFNNLKLVDKWPLYSYYHEDREKYITFGGINKPTEFENWSRIEFLNQPLNSVLLLDLYLFQDKETIKSNFSELIYVLTRGKYKDDLYFLNLCSDRDPKDNPRPIDAIYSDVKESFVSTAVNKGFSSEEAHSLFHSLKFNLQHIFRGEYSDPEVKRLHDRFLLTNNILIYSPSGFDINGKKSKKNTFIRFDFIFYKDVFLRATGYVDNIREYIKGINNENNCYPVEQIDRIKNHPFFFE